MLTNFLSFQMIFGIISLGNQSSLLGLFGIIVLVLLAYSLIFGFIPFFIARKVRPDLGKLAFFFCMLLSLFGALLGFMVSLSISGMEGNGFLVMLGAALFSGMVPIYFYKQKKKTE